MCKTSADLLIHKFMSSRADWGDIYLYVMGATKRERKTLLAITIRAENLEAISHRL